MKAFLMILSSFVLGAIACFLVTMVFAAIISGIVHPEMGVFNPVGSKELWLLLAAVVQILPIPITMFFTKLEMTKKLQIVSGYGLAFLLLYLQWGGAEIIDKAWRRGI